MKFTTASMGVPTAFVLTLVVGTLLAILVSKWFLPRFGDWVATFFYSSGEQGSTGNSDATLAKLARGDFNGAIWDLEKRLTENPKDLQAIREIAKIRAENLEDVDGALRELRARLSEANWSLDERAFLRLRCADTLERAERYEEAIQELHSITVDFPKTRHSANARHRLNLLQKR